MGDGQSLQQPSADAEVPASLLRVSQRAQAAAALVSALGKAARAFTLYDPTNAIVRKFIEDYGAHAEAATATGPVPVEVKPFELLLDGEVVYKEDDRERSLAFRLFRDGVRRVTFLPGVTSRELLHLLQILAIRYTGIRQAEDDVVTLLRKAELRTILVTAVEGYAPEEEVPEEEGVRTSGGEPPPDFDQPLPRLPPPGPVAYRHVPDEALAQLRAEAAPEALPRSALQLAAELLAWATRGALPVPDAAQYCAELRDYLVAAQDLTALAQLADLVQRLPAGQLRDEVLRGLADVRLLEAVLAAVESQGGGELPPAAARLLPFVPVAAVLECVAAEADPVRSQTLVRLASARLPAETEAITRRLASMPAEAARALFRAVASAVPERADTAAVALLGHKDPAVKTEGLRALAASSHRVPPGPILDLLASDAEPLRVAAAAALERHGDAATARAVAESLATRRDCTREEAAALGRLVAALNAGAALRLFDAWLEPKRRLLGARKVSDHEAVLQWAAVSGLGAIPGAEAEQRLEDVVKRADEALRRHCHATMARRRAEGRRHG